MRLGRVTPVSGESWWGPGATRRSVTPRNTSSPPDQADLLVTVAVNNVTGLGDLQQVEFGRWLGSGQQLAVDMPEAGGHVAQELVRMSSGGVGGGVPVGSEWGCHPLPAAGPGRADVLPDVSLHLRGAARSARPRRPPGEQGKGLGEWGDAGGMPSPADSPGQGLDLFLPHQRGCFPRTPTMPAGEQSHPSHPSLLGWMRGLCITRPGSQSKP